ncbi:penicillin-binding protein 1A [Gracilibacillus halotolerans]|uniref:Penicillin-binding protein 1A n=1 Tax=Gracilibacillus halotolerans TaxID=74386 RepID=A0A841RGL8_9BACI|nr:penicillin-binding protein 1A [Gracilibacillus halotolerans]MBB6511619.1 penicillin-binding protein 1A [Gracilibacillus halotolerans]
MANEQSSRKARRKQAQKQKSKNKPLWKRIFRIALIAILLIGLGVGSVFGYYVVTAPDLDEELLADPASTKLLDINGDIFADLGVEKRSKISYNDIPDILEDAILATEDVRFFNHIGIDFRRIGAAVLANFSDGFGSQGASTITQQVVKGSFLSDDKTMKRKVQEQWLSLKLEQKYSKEEIFEMYVNKIYYGAGAYGAATAAEVYFGKTDLNDLTLPEAALLAGLPQRPSAYDPFVNPDLAKERMETVLNLMVRHNKISQAEADEALEVDVTSLLTTKRKDYVKYEGFIQQVEEEIEEKTGLNIYEDSLKIHTTIDPKAQEHVEFLLSDDESNPINYSSDPEMQVGLTVVDTQTGAIRAVGPGRNRDSNGWNYAIHGDGRQPGSTIKPLTVYGPAVEHMKMSTYHQLLDDKPYPIKGTDDVIRNAGRNYSGWVTAREALTRSLNVPTVKLMEEVGYENAKEFAKGLGLSFHEDSLTIGDAIGGTASTATPLEMAGAYAAFGNGGVYHEPYAVTKIEYPNGKVEEFKSKAEIAMEDYTAYMVTDMLKSVVQSGTGKSANISGLPMAGKTGTTNLDEKLGGGNPDVWFVGYTTNYTISVWTGHDKATEVLDKDVKGIARQLYRETMTYISEGVETKDFEKPSSVVEVKVEKGTNPPKLPSDYTPSSNIITELFVKGTEPSKVSETFDELEAVTNLSATYNEDSESIDVTWDHDNEDAEFKVSVGTSQDNLRELTTTDSTNVTIESVEKGSSYFIQVIAFTEELESEPASTSVEIESDQPDSLEAVTQLSQELNPNALKALVSWQYSSEYPVEFEVSVQMDGSTIENLTTNKNQLNLTQLQPEKTYTVTVTPVLKEPSLRGPSNSVQISTHGLSKEEENNQAPPPEDNEEDPDEAEENEQNEEENNQNNQNNGNNASQEQDEQEE